MTSIAIDRGASIKTLTDAECSLRLAEAIVDVASINHSELVTKQEFQASRRDFASLKESVTQDIKVLRKDVKALHNDVSKQNQDIKILRNEFNEHKQDFQVLCNDVNEQKHAIKTLRDVVNEQNLDIKTLRNDFSEQHKDVCKNFSEVRLEVAEVRINLARFEEVTNLKIDTFISNLNMKIVISTVGGVILAVALLQAVEYLLKIIF